MEEIVYNFLLSQKLFTNTGNNGNSLFPKNFDSVETISFFAPHKPTEIHYSFEGVLVFKHISTYNGFGDMLTFNIIII